MGLSRCAALTRLPTSDGTVFMYNVHSKEVGQFSLGRDCKEQGLSEARVWSSGVVALTREFSLSLHSLCTLSALSR